jgi:dihydroxyacetone kinase-like predicted kinase
VHVHVDDPGAAVEAGVAAGRPRQIRIENLAEQSAGSAAAWAHPATVPSRQGFDAGLPLRRTRAQRTSTGPGLVACAAGPGLARLFREVGAVVVPTGPGRRPSTGEILEALHATGAETVAVLPNDPDTLAVAAAAASAARGEGVRVTVLPTRAQVQGLAAAAVHDPNRTFEADMVEMTAAAGATRHGAVTVAAKEAMTMAGPCRIGDALGVVQGDFAVVGSDLTQVACEVVDRLLTGGGELLSLVRGAGAEPGLTEAVAAHVRRGRRDVETTVYDGGQDRYPLLIGVE